VEDEELLETMELFDDEELLEIMELFDDEGLLETMELFDDEELFEDAKRSRLLRPETSLHFKLEVICV